MNAPIAAVMFLLGLVILTATARGVLGTMIAPGGRPSRLVFATVPLVIRVSRYIRRHAPSSGVRRLAAGMVGPMVLLLPTLVWGVGAVIGAALLAAAVGAAPPDIRALPYVFGQLEDARWHGNGFAVALLATLALISAALVARTTAVAIAYQRRERFLWVLANEARSCLDAEDLIITHMRTGTPGSLDRMLGAWQLWIADLRFTHTNYPELLALPSSPVIPWPDATLVLLDVAALIDALSPEVEPPPTRPLLASGCMFVQEMARELRLKVVKATPSLHGREERSFSTTLARLADAGICPAGVHPTARASFQRWRSRYAPYTAALSDLLSEETRDPVTDFIPQVWRAPHVDPSGNASTDERVEASPLVVG